MREASGRPAVSVIMPCYNEAGNVGYSIPRLFHAFQAAGHPLQVVAVDNGSTDDTCRRLEALAAAHPGITITQVQRNIGYGNGVLSGIPDCRGEWICIVAADGQVDPEDVVRLYEAALSADWPVVAKVRRRFRMDGFLRKIVSIGYNAYVNILWPGLGSLDVNGTPRLLPRELAHAMRLESTDWLIDPEMLIKARCMGVRILELNVFARMRGSGLSHVRASTCWEFFHRLLGIRLGSQYRTWRRELARPERGAATPIERAATSA